MSANDIISQWVNDYADEMYRYAFSKTSKQEASEDIVQNTFLAAVQSFSSFKNESSPKTWLYSILKNKIMDFHRDTYKRAEVRGQSDDDSFLDIFFSKDDHWKKESGPDSWDSDEHLLDNVDFNNALKACMEKLPSKWNSAIQLKYIDDRDANLICQELEITASNYWQVLHRAKLQLRECLERNWFKK